MRGTAEQCSLGQRGEGLPQRMDDIYSANIYCCHTTVRWCPAERRVSILGCFKIKTSQKWVLSTFCAQTSHRILEIKPAGSSVQIGGLSHHMNVHVSSLAGLQRHIVRSACVEESQGGSDLFAGMQLQSCGEIWITHAHAAPHYLPSDASAVAACRYSAANARSKRIRGWRCTRGAAQIKPHGAAPGEDMLPLCWLESLSPLPSVPLNSMPSASPHLYVLRRGAPSLNAHFIHM